MVEDDVLRSGDFSLPGFAPHGEISLRHADGLLLWHLEGPFNADAMRRFRLLRRAGFERWKLAGEWLGAVVHWSGSALMAPDAFEAYREGLQGFVRAHQRIAAVAWVAAPELEGLRFVHKPFERLYADEGLPFASFDNSCDAQAWARSHLATCRSRPGVPVQALGSLSRSMSMNCQKSTQKS